MERTTQQQPLIYGSGNHDEQIAPQRVSILPRNATPEEVRTFVSDLLTTRRKLPETHVRHIVANWQFGSGHELSSYPPAMFIKIFGHEAGWIIYRETRLAMHEATYEATANSALLKALPFVPFALALSFLLLVVLLIKTDVVRGHIAVAFWLTLAVIFSGAAFNSAISSYIDRLCPEANVEDELQTCAKKMMS